MVLDDGIEVLNNIFMIQILDEIDLLLYGLDFFLTDLHLLHGYKHTIVEIYSLMD